MPTVPVPITVPVRLKGVSVAVPARAICWVPPGALSVRSTCSEKAPVAPVGWKVKDRSAEPPAAMDAGRSGLQPNPEPLKTVGLLPVKSSSALPMFSTVTVWPALVVPRAVGPKVREGPEAKSSIRIVAPWMT